MNKKLFKKAVTVVVATILGVTTIFPSTIALASENKTFEWNIDNLVVNTYDGGKFEFDVSEDEKNKVTSEFKEAFSKCITESIAKGKTTHTVNTKDFKMDGMDAYISKIEATKIIDSNGEFGKFSEDVKDVIYDVVKRNDIGHPSSFSVSFDLSKEYIEEGLINVFVTLADGSEKNYLLDIICDEELLDGYGEAKENTDVSKEDNKKVANNKEDKKEEKTTQKPTDKPTQKPTEKPVDNKKETPTTADEMSTAFMYVIILGSVSVLSLASIYAYKRKNNI